MVEFNNFLIYLDGYIGSAPWFPMLLIEQASFSHFILVSLSLDSLPMGGEF